MDLDLSRNGSSETTYDEGGRNLAVGFSLLRNCVEGANLNGLRYLEAQCQLLLYGIEKEVQHC